MSARGSLDAHEPTTRTVAAKSLLQRVLSSRYMAAVWQPLSWERISIFALHRFRAPELNVDGHDPALLARTLERLRRERYAILSLEEAVKRLKDRSDLPPRSLVFTVDDGYADFAAVAAPVFSAFDVPVTVFVTTGFIEGTHWLWWDQISYVLRRTRARSLSIPLDGTGVTLQLGDDVARSRIARQVSVNSTRLPETARKAFIAALASAADVEIPATPAPSYAAMTWTDCRRLENQGVSFAPHTVSHPILIRTTEADAAWQISESWNRLRERVARPVPILAYPNGDYTPREFPLLGRAGLMAAVTTEPRYASADVFHQEHGRFMIPRFPYPDRPNNVCLTAAGFTRVSAAVRRAFAFVQ
jgi:peptidoglycan/xylan/chitin deacetylase (PgdA/CDA1 family)